MNQPTGIAQQLATKYRKPLAKAQRELLRAKRGSKNGVWNDHADLTLFLKWAYRVGKGWYGFNLGIIPDVWSRVLDDFLGWLETTCPDFEIHQVKMKGAGVRIYLGTKKDLFIPDEMIRAEIRELERLLSLRPSVPPSDCSAKKPIRKSFHKS